MPRTKKAPSSPLQSTQRKRKHEMVDTAEARDTFATLENEVKNGNFSTTPKSQRGSKAAPMPSTDIEVIDLTGDNNDASSSHGRSKITKTPNNHSPSKKRTQGRTHEQPEEKRLRHFRSHAPQSYLVKLDRALTQRMFVLNRTREASTPESPREVIDLAGSTGNVYSVTVAHVPHCTCPDFKKGNQCKHIVYVLVNVLRAPEHLQYQLAFLTSELHVIFDNAPLPIEKAETKGQDPGKRKPIEGDCPICFTEMKENEHIVWCKVACGNNIHKECFQQWAASQRGRWVTCVYCRSPWTADDENSERLLKYGDVNDEGYVNVAEQLGMSGARDTSTYHWPRRRRGGWGYW